MKLSSRKELLNEAENEMKKRNNNGSVFFIFLEEVVFQR